MGFVVSPRAVQIMRRALEAARLDPATHGIRVRVARGNQVHTGFADEPDDDEVVIESGGVTLFVAKSLAEDGATLDVSAEHDRLIVTR